MAEPYPQVPQHAQPISYATPVMANDRSGGLLVFGVISIILGALAGCGALATPLALVGARFQPPGAPRIDARTIVTGLAVYAAVSAAFITLGIGSVRRRRWVRPIILSVSLPALVGGTFGFVVLLFLLPELFRQVPGQPPIPPGMVRGMQWATAGFSLFLYVVLPAAYFFYYRSSRVRDTLDVYDPGPAWTDRCPLPVFGLSVWLALACAAALGTALFPAVPLFGRYVSGAAAVGIVMVVMALLAAAAVLVYRVNVTGWWIATALLVLISTSYAYTAYTRGMLEYYRSAGFDEQQIQLMAQMSASRPRRWESLASLVPAGMALAYLVWVSRYFRGTPRPPALHNPPA
jgi:hypothetical protein